MPPRYQLVIFGQLLGNVLERESSDYVVRYPKISEQERCLIVELWDVLVTGMERTLRMPGKTRR